MAGTVPAGSRVAPGTMHPLPPSRGERLGTALLPCWQQGHLHTASVPHRRKVLPMGVQPRDPETTPEGLMSREMVAQGWGLVSLRSPQGRVGGQELIPGTQAAFPGGFPGTKGCPARLRAGEGRHPQAAPPAVWVPRGDSPTPRGLPGVPHTSHPWPPAQTPPGAPPHSSAPPAHTRGLSHKPDPPHIPPTDGGGRHTHPAPHLDGAHPTAEGTARGHPTAGCCPRPPAGPQQQDAPPDGLPHPSPPAICTSAALPKRPQTSPNLPRAALRAPAPPSPTCSEPPPG